MYVLVNQGAVVDGPRSLPTAWRNVSGLNILTASELATKGWYSFNEEQWDDNAYDKGIPLDQINGSVFSRTYPDAALKSDAELKLFMKTKAELRFNEAGSGGFNYSASIPCYSDNNARGEANMVLSAVTAGETYPAGYKIRDMNGIRHSVNWAQFKEYHRLMTTHLVICRNVLNGLLDAIEGATGQDILDIDIEGVNWPLLSGLN